MREPSPSTGTPSWPRRSRWALAACLAAVLVQLWARSGAPLSRGATATAAPPKPAHCRADLPGCVPRRIDYLYLLHGPKAAGVSVQA